MTTRVVTLAGIRVRVTDVALTFILSSRMLTSTVDDYLCPGSVRVCGLCSMVTHVISRIVVTVNWSLVLTSVGTALMIRVTVTQAEF